MRNIVWVAALGVLVAGGVVSGSVENFHPVPEGLADFGCGDKYFLLGSRRPAVVSRHFQAQSDQAIGQTLSFLRAVPGLKENRYLEALAKWAMERVSNPNQWVDFTPTSGKEGSHAGEDFMKHAQFEPGRAVFVTGIKFAQPINGRTSKDVLFGTLRWPDTKYVPFREGDWTMRVVFTNTELGVFILDVVFEQKIKAEAN